MQWLNQCIDQLNLQIDSFEAEIESLAGQSKKKKNRGENADKIDDYNNLCEKHREHVGKLETLLRMLDNDAVNISQVTNPRMLIYYLSSFLSAKHVNKMFKCSFENILKTINELLTFCLHRYQNVCFIRKLMDIRQSNSVKEKQTVLYIL